MINPTVSLIMSMNCSLITLEDNITHFSWQDNKVDKHTERIISSINDIFLNKNPYTKWEKEYFNETILIVCKKNNRVYLGS